VTEPSGPSARASRRGQTLVRGHALRCEGAGFVVNELGTPLRARGSQGRALCECGVLSPILTSGGERKRWHAAHKAGVRDA
jgi:hypothetical protein